MNEKEIKMRLIEIRNILIQNENPMSNNSIQEIMLLVQNLQENIMKKIEQSNKIQTPSTFQDRESNVHPKLKPEDFEVKQENMTKSPFRDEKSNIHPKLKPEDFEVKQETLTKSPFGDEKNNIHPKLEPEDFEVEQEILTKSPFGDERPSIHPKLKPEDFEVEQEILTKSPFEDEKQNIHPKLKPEESKREQERVTINPFTGEKLSLGWSPNRLSEIEQKMLVDFAAGDLVFSNGLIPSAELKETHINEETGELEQKGERLSLRKFLDIFSGYNELAYKDYGHTICYMTDEELEMLNELEKSPFASKDNTKKELDEYDER